MIGIAEDWQEEDRLTTSQTVKAALSEVVRLAFTARLIDVVVLKFREFFFRREICEIGCVSNCRYCADCAQNMPGRAPNNVLPVLQSSSKSVHFQRSYIRTREHRFCPEDYFHHRLLEPIVIRPSIGLIEPYFLIKLNNGRKTLRNYRSCSRVCWSFHFAKIVFICGPKNVQLLSYDIIAITTIISGGVKLTKPIR